MSIPLFGEKLVQELRKLSDRVNNRLWIAVPYIGGIKVVRRIIGKKWMDKTRLSIRLLTDINELGHFNSDSISLFNEIGQIRNLVGLHAKIFIIDNKCLITSANLTNTAFSKRYEIGMFLNPSLSAKTLSIFESWWRKSDPVYKKDIKKFSKKVTISTDESNFPSLPNLWALPEDPGELNYWLKPIGVTGDPITEDQTFDKIKMRLHFSKAGAKTVKIDDTLIAYGIGAKRILSIFKVISKPRYLGENKRWPWYVNGLNLTTRFGKKWAKYNIYGNKILEEYLLKHPSKTITKVGGKTLGGLNYGRDKLNLDMQFAQFIISKIKKLNTK